MDDGEDPGYVFAIPDLWASSRFLPDSDNLHSFLFSPLNFEDISVKLPDQVAGHNGDGGFFALPDFPFESPELSIIPSSTPSLSETADETNIQSDGDIDIWSFAPEKDLKSANYLTWSAFEDQKEETPHTCYISESGPQLFDSAVADDSRPLQINNKDSTVVGGSIYAASLLSLGLGRNSVLFSWNEETVTFEYTLKSVRTSGCSTELTKDVTALFLRCGNTTKALRSFTDKVYLKHQSPGRIALADAVLTVLSTLQAHLNIPIVSLQSILKLQSLFRPVDRILSIFHEVIQVVGSAKNDEAMLSQLYHLIEQTEHRADSMQAVLLEVLSRVSRPFLDFVGEWMGLQQETGLPVTKGGLSKSFVKAEDRVWIDEQGMEIHAPDFVLDESRVPSFLAEDDTRMMFEAGKSLRMLREHHPEHPLARGDVITSTAPPVLQWEFSWQNVEAIEIKAQQYEKDLSDAVKKYTTSGFANRSSAALPPIEPIEELNLFGKPAEEMEAHLLQSIESINLSPTITNPPNRLSTLLHTLLASPQSPTPHLTLPFTLAPHLSFTPLITARSLTLSTTALSLLLHSHNLRHHLTLHRDFHLLRNGVFASRLAHALFDPSLATAERHRGVARWQGTMGLRLGGRDSWPPASSELRLALAGVLTESYIPPHSSSPPSHPHQHAAAVELPGDLSFAVRDMSPAEMQACLDPTSASALDFLRLSYKPPPPLDAVITPESLHMYDRAFRVLLRVLRMQFVVGQLFRDLKGWGGDAYGGAGRWARRLRWEVQHFVGAVGGYFEEGVERAWRVVEGKIGEVEERLRGGEKGGLGRGEGVDGLKGFHEGVLRGLMGMLLSRKRQEGVMAVLEEVFGIILRFAAWSAKGDGREEEVRELYSLFTGRVRVFVAACRAMEEKGGKRSSDRRRGGGGGLFDVEEVGVGEMVGGLLARLEASGYYM